MRWRELISAQGFRRGLQPQNPEQKHANPYGSVAVSPGEKESGIMVCGGYRSAPLREDVGCADDAETSEKPGFRAPRVSVAEEEQREKDQSAEYHSPVQRNGRDGKDGDERQREPPGKQQVDGEEKWCGVPEPGGRATQVGAP